MVSAAERMPSLQWIWQIEALLQTVRVLDQMSVEECWNQVHLVALVLTV